MQHRAVEQVGGVGIAILRMVRLGVLAGCGGVILGVAGCQMSANLGGAVQHESTMVTVAENDIATSQPATVVPAPAPTTVPSATAPSQAAAVAVRPFSPSERRADGVTLDVGLERKDWPVERLHVTGGTVNHFPVYFRDCPLREDAGVIDLHTPIAEQIDASLDQADDRCGDGTKFRDAGAQIGKWAFDLIALPVRMVLTPPWASETTPDRSN